MVFLTFDERPVMALRRHFRRAPSSPTDQYDRVITPYNKQQGAWTMLILTREDGESIFIGEDTEVTVLGINGNYVKIGIDAPKDVEILREELLEEYDEAG